MKKFVLVLTTVPEEKRGQRIAAKLVEERLAACVTVSSACQSIYWWEDKVTKDQEYLLYIKTKSSLYARLEARLKELHPYDVPEIIGLPLEKASKEYLDWVDKETRG
jgi:periplasmic divalent cation tolerance protein